MPFLIRARLLMIGSLVVASESAFAAFPDCFTDRPLAADLTAWRQSALTMLPSDSTKVAGAIKACFGQQIPVCLKRVYSYADRKNVVTIDKDTTFEATPERQPPKEFLAPGATGLVYYMPPNLEQLAKDNGWPAVRYKSRHSGGFDTDTSSLFMVYVPGDKRNPPVNYDQWLNFALPADKSPDELDPTPKAPIPTEADFANEASSGIRYPRTLTMVSLIRAKDNEPAKVFFQMFSRQNTGSGNYVPSNPRPLRDCLSCHPNGLRPISPLGYHVGIGEKQMPEADWAAVKIMNEAMDDLAGGKLVSWRGASTGNPGEQLSFIKPEADWPVVGPIKPMNNISRTQAFIMGGTLPDGTTTPGCYKAKPTISITDIFGRPPGAKNIYTLSSSPIKDWTKVRNAMLCETCHNNRLRYALNSQTDVATINYKILVDQSMPIGMHTDPYERGDMSLPPSDRLTPDERIGLVNCLQAEMALETNLRDQWLTQENCQ